MAEYTWRDGGGHGVSADVAQNEFERLRARDGGLRTGAIVDAARPQDAPLHPAFEWDDRVAGERYREAQARRMVRSVVLVEQGQPETRVWVNVPVKVVTDPTPREYQPIALVSQDVALYQAALRDLMARLRQAEAAVDELQRLAGRVHAQASGQITAVASAVATARELSSGS